MAHCQRLGLSLLYFNYLAQGASFSEGSHHPLKVMSAGRVYPPCSASYLNASEIFRSIRSCSEPFALMSRTSTALGCTLHFSNRFSTVGAENDLTTKSSFLNIQRSLGCTAFRLVVAKNEAHQDFVTRVNGAADMSVDFHKITRALRPRNGDEHGKKRTRHYSVTTTSHHRAMDSSALERSIHFWDGCNSRRRPVEQS